MCGLCKKREAKHPIRVNANGHIVNFNICDHCLAVSEHYCLAVCNNCQTVSWMLKLHAEQINNEKIGKRFTVLFCESCIACGGYHFEIVS